MSETESNKTAKLCLNFKGNGDSVVRGLLRDPSRVGHHHPKTLQVTGLVFTTEQSLEEDSGDESATVTTENRSKCFHSE